MENKRRAVTHLPKKAWEYSEIAYLNMPAASPTDFTGYTPTIPETEEEALAYESVMPAPVTAKEDGDGE